MKKRSIDNYMQETIEGLQRSHQQIMVSTVLVEASMYGMRGLPAESEASIEPFISAIRGQYIQLKNETRGKLRGDLQKFVGSVNVASFNERIESGRKQAADQGRVLSQLDSDKRRITVTHSERAYRHYLWLLYLFALGEIVINVSCFLNIGDIFIIALIISIVLGFAQIIAAKTTTLAIREVPNPLKRRLYYLCQFIAFAVFSTGIGLLRYHYAIKEAGSVPVIFLNPATFASMNLLLVVASIMLVYFYFPSRRETRDLDRIRQINQEITKCATSISGLQDQEAALIVQRSDAIQLHSELIYAERQLLSAIDALYDTAVGVFKSENIAKRSDSCFPECFRNPHAPLPDMEGTQFHFMTTK